MGQYDKPRIPPSTPPVIAPDADEEEAAHAPVDGDSAKSGSVESAHSPVDADAAESTGDPDARKLAGRNALDGGGEQTLDETDPDYEPDTGSEKK